MTAALYALFAAVPCNQWTIERDDHTVTLVHKTPHGLIVLHFNEDESQTVASAAKLLHSLLAGAALPGEAES